MRIKELEKGDKIGIDKGTMTIDDLLIQDTEWLRERAERNIVMSSRTRAGEKYRQDAFLELGEEEQLEQVLNMSRPPLMNATF